MSLLAVILGIIKALLGLGNKVADAAHDANLKQDGANAVIVQANEAENARITEAAAAGSDARARADAVLAAPVELDPDNERANPALGLLATKFRAASKVPRPGVSGRTGNKRKPAGHGKNRGKAARPKRKHSRSKRST